MSVDSFDPVLAAQRERLRTQRDAKDIHKKGDAERRGRLDMINRQLNPEVAKHSKMRAAATRAGKKPVTLPSVKIKED